MAEANPYAGPRWLAYLMSAIAVVTLIAAALETPVGDWSSTNYLFGAVLVFFAAAFAIAGIRGTFNLVGRLSGKTSMILAAVGSLAAVVVIVGTLAGATWNVDTILTTGLWVALLVMFAGTVVVARRKMQAGL
jgi:hypothetical protein